MVSVDVKQHLKKKSIEIDLGSCVEVEVDVLGSPSLIIVLMVFAGVKQH